MRRSWHLGTFLGIQVRVHFTFALLLGYVLLSGLMQSGDAGFAVARVSFVVALFFFVVLHEYGHALAARAYGIPTRQITLYPIGGIAMLERMPDRPRAQLVIALAGPAVNFALAGVFAALGAASGSLGFASIQQLGLYETFLLVNLTMGIFNLLPALPMDGGRVLRALLQLRFGPHDATRIASRVARYMAVGMALLAIVPPLNGSLLLIAGFVWLASGAEARAAAATPDRPRWVGQQRFRDSVQARSGERPARVVDFGAPPEQDLRSSDEGARGVPHATRVVLRVVPGPDGPRLQWVRV